MGAPESELMSEFLVCLEDSQGKLEKAPTAKALAHTEASC